MQGEIFWGGVPPSQVATGGAVTTQSGQPVTVTRSTVEQCSDASGFFHAIAANSPCVEPNGLAIRPTVVNLFPKSSDMSGITCDSTSCTSGQACSTGGTGAVLARDTVANSAHRFYEAPSSLGAGTYTFAGNMAPAIPGGGIQAQVWLGASSEEATYDLIQGTLSTGDSPTGFSGFTLTNTGFAVYPMDAGWLFTSYTMTDAVGPSFNQFHLGTTYDNLVNGYVGGDAGMYFCNPQVTFTTDIRHYCPNTNSSGSATCNPDVVAVANPLDGGNFVFNVSPLLDGYRWDTGYYRGMMADGWDAGDINTAVWFVSDAGFQTVQVYDSSQAVKTTVASTIVWPGRHELTWRHINGADFLYQDNVQLGTTTTGTGSGVISHQPRKPLSGLYGVRGPDGRSQSGRRRL